MSFFHFPSYPKVTQNLARAGRTQKANLFLNRDGDSICLRLIICYTAASHCPWISRFALFLAVFQKAFHLSAHAHSSAPIATLTFCLEFPKFPSPLSLVGALALWKRCPLGLSGWKDVYALLPPRFTFIRGLLFLLCILFQPLAIQSYIPSSCDKCLLNS